jgi:hypothetical protein
MAEIAVTCEVSCQLCGWKTGATVFGDEARLFPDILAFLSQSGRQHTKQGSTGRLLIEWQPAERASVDP